MTEAGRVLSLVAGLSYALIMAPIIVVVVMAFSADSFILFPPSGFSLRWFKTLVSNAPLMKALWLSVQIALVVTVLSLLVGVPAALSLEKAAAIPVNYITAWIMLIKLGALQKGERVLIHAAAGGVGQAALQLAKWRGAEVFGTASASKHARLKSLGVAHCIDYHTQDFEEEVRRITGGKGVHVIIDAVGGR